MGCARGQEQTTRKNVVLTFNLVDEIHKTVVLSFENVVMQCLRAITQMEPARQQCLCEDVYYVARRNYLLQSVILKMNRTT